MSYNDWKDKTVSFKMSKKSGMDVEAIIERIKGLINQHFPWTENAGCKDDRRRRHGNHPKF